VRELKVVFVVECSLCGARAVYYRFSSGHYLCLGCLSRVLERAIRRGLSPLNALRPGSRILVPITYYGTLASLALADIMSFIKRGYGSMVYVAIPDFVDLRGLPGRLGGLSVLPVSVEPKPCYEDPVLAIHYDRLWSLKLASLLNLNVVLEPLTRTDLTLLSMEIPLRGYDEAWSLLNPITSVNGVSLVNALAGVEAEPIVSYAILSGYDAEVRSRCTPKLRTSRILGELRGLGPEVEFSSYKTIEFILGIVEEGIKGRCPYCGGLSRNKGPCKLCQTLEAPSLKVQLGLKEY
jgi:hypothetical protein